MHKNLSDFKYAVPIAFIFFVLFALLQKTGLVDLVNSDRLGLGTAFIIGFIASLSTCMAMVGGLLLSMSASFAKNGQGNRSQIFFHVGRLASFFLFGGVIGVIGSAFTLSVGVNIALSIIVGLIMLVLGINLLGIFDWSDRLLPSIPSSVAMKVKKLSLLNNSFTPLLVGIATFFMPCGFTQSMQIYTLSSGSFLAGAMTMLFFALGTLPVLAFISFGSLNIGQSPKAGIFFKTAGLIVIIFALFNVINSVTAGSLYRIGNFSLESATDKNIGTVNNVSIVDGKQIIEINARGGYFPKKTIAQAGIPTVVRFNTKGTFDCSASVRIPSLDIFKILPQSGVTDIDIGDLSAGPLQGSCGMGMYPFEIEFVENEK